MEADSRARLIARIKSSPKRHKDVLAFLDAHDIRPDAGGEYDVQTMAHEVVMALHRLVTGQAYDPADRALPVALESRYWSARLRSLPHQELAAMRWLLSASARSHEMPPSEVRDAYHRCLRRHWTIRAPVFLRPAAHAGVEVGLGAFALVPLRAGQSLFQFTGALHPEAKRKSVLRGERVHYAIRCRHGRHAMLVDPTVDLDLHIAGRINEPSPLARGSNARHRPTQRNVLIHDHLSKSLRYEAEFADGTRILAEARDLTPLAPPIVHHANCVWFDFPVPLECYRLAGADRSGTMLTFRLHDRTRCTTRLTRAEADAQYELVTTLADGVQKMTRGHAIPAGAIVTLKPGVFDGLVRQGNVVRSEDGLLHVSHRVEADVGWKLPRIVLAGKLARCAACRKGEDDPRCPACTVAAYPMVYTCTDVAVGDELLCLYHPTPVQKRGTPCLQPLSNETIGPLWSDGIVR